MPRRLRPFSILGLGVALIALGLVFARGADAEAPANRGVIPGRYIVVLQEGTDAAGYTNILGRRHGFSVDLVYRQALRGFAASLSPDQVNALLADPKVNNVVPDRVVRAVDTTPTGIDRIDAEGSSPPGGGDYSGVRVAILDTGIDLDHPDLNVSDTCQYNSMGGADADDGHGHGTHVAGTVGAIAGNGLGVRGTAPGVTLCPVKVLDDSGSGSWSGVIAGIDWVTATRTDGDPNNDIAVASMSLGGCAVVFFIWCLASPPPNNASCGFDGATVTDPLHWAICQSTKAGVVHVVAAGNDGSPALYFVPAAYPEAVTVSAIADSDGWGGGLGPSTSYGADDTFASFSNYGEAADIAAPGVDILSTWSSGGYNTISGTSMATPHVTGAVAKLIGDSALSVGPSSDSLAAHNAAMSAFDSKPQTDPACGFSGDPDVYPEPLVYVGQPNDNCGGSSGPTPTPAPSPTPTPTPTPAPCPAGGNDGFEAGLVDTNEIPCWTVVDMAGGSGSWCNQTGTSLPQGACSGSPTSVVAPPEGLQAAMTNQTGPGSHALYRCGFLASGAISFQLYINNEWPFFYSPDSLDYTGDATQQFRADLVTAAGIAADPFTVAPADILINIYQTLPGDPLVSGYLPVLADASAFVGQDVCLRFATADNVLYFHAGVDDVTVDLGVELAPTPNRLHVGDLDGQGVKLQRGHWKAVVTIMVDDADHNAVAGASVNGTFYQNGASVGPFICVTSASGTCSIDSGQLPSKDGKTTFIVGHVVHDTLSYDATANHDPDGDKSSGTSITVGK